MKDDLVRSGAVVDWLKRLEETLTTTVYHHVAFAFLPGQVPELTLSGLRHALCYGSDIPKVVV